MCTNFVHSAHKKTLYIFIVFYFLYFLSFALLIIKPTIFYYRAWEYFDEIGFHIPNKSKWKGYETGDQGRSYIYSFQKHWPTSVTTDDEGFRSVPFQSEKFPIVIMGDSHTWGSGLSDEDTIPWKVAFQLGIPTFNGGRLPFTLSKMLQNPRLKESKIIIELVAQHLLCKDMFAKSDFTVEDYEIYACDRSWKNYFEIHPKRYFFPLKILRNLNIQKNVFNEFTKKQVDSSIIEINRRYTYALKKEDLDIVIQNICKRSEQLKKLGYQYVIGLIPSKVLQLSHQIDQRDIDQEIILAEALKQNQVAYIDICKIFRNNESRAFYLPTDSHINPLGAAVVSEAITNYLTENYQDILHLGKHLPLPNYLSGVSPLNALKKK